jgi:hypothetical protein
MSEMTTTPNTRVSIIQRKSINANESLERNRGSFREGTSPVVKVIKKKVIRKVQITTTSQDEFEKIYQMKNEKDKEIYQDEYESYFLSPLYDEKKAKEPVFITEEELEKNRKYNEENEKRILKKLRTFSRTYNYSSDSDSDTPKLSSVPSFNNLNSSFTKYSVLKCSSSWKRQMYNISKDEKQKVDNTFKDWKSSLESHKYLESQAYNKL